LAIISQEMTSTEMDLGSGCWLIAFLGATA